MAFQIAPLNVPNLTTDYSGEISAASQLGRTVAGLPEQWRKQQQQAEMATLGEGISNGAIDPTKAAGRFFALGQPELGLGLMKLAETQKQRTLGQEATQGLVTALGGGSPFLGAPAAPAAPMPAQPGDDPRSKASLISNESGGRWDAQNSATGAGGMKGHFGRIQFGQARLQEAAASGAIPPGTTPQAFMASPELQRAAETWHWNDIDQTIAANGYDRLVGQPINGVPVTIDGLRAVAHLGGKEGMRRFVETGGRYNPTDENGTSLMDYFSRHGGGRTRIAGADMPAPGARPASMESGQEGFAVPGSPAMSGRTFDAITAGAPLDPVFQSEGVSQPWMGTALRGQPAPARAAAVAQQTLPPPRPFDAGSALASPADMPAPGAVPAIGRYAPTEDLSNSSDAGSRTFAASQAAPAMPYPAAPTSARPSLAPPANNPLLPPKSGPQPNPQAGTVPFSPRSAAPATDAAPPVALGAPAAPVAGDDPATLRRDAAAYAQTNPEAARQLNARADAAERAQRADMPAAGATETQAPAPRLSQDMPRPTNAREAQDYRATRQMEEARGKAGRIAAALANPSLPANARALGEILLKEALEQSKAPESVKEFQYAKAMGWTTAKSPAEYAKEKTKTSPLEDVEGRKAAAASIGLKPGDPRYETYVLTGKTPREDAQPLSATDKKAIMEADDGILAANTAIEALRTAKQLSPRALAGWGAGAKASVANNLPDWMVPDGLVASPQKAEATAELENVVTSQALAQLKSIFGAAPTEGERKILLDIQGSIGQPDNVRQKIYDRGIAMAERRLAFNQQRANELRGGSYYKPGDGAQRQTAPQGRQQGAPQDAPQRQTQPDLSQARQAPDGNFYIPDPSRPGKYLMVQP